MKTIVILEDGDRIASNTISVISSADVLIDNKGVVIANRSGETGYKINMPELQRVLSTRARGPRAKQ